MKTDQPIYLYLSAGPEAFRILSGGLTVNGPYRFESMTIKGLERRLDGIIEPLAPEQTVWALEFQGQGAEALWYNLLVKIGLYGERHPRRDVQGLGVFLRAADAPALPRRIAGVDSPVRAVYLDEVLAMLSIFTAIEETSGSQAIKAEGWKEGREEGRQEGEAAGVARARAEDLTRLLGRRFGPLPPWATARIATAPVAQLDAWLDGIFDAPALTALLGPEEPPTH